MKKTFSLSLLVAFFSLALQASAYESPSCLAKDKPLPIDNEKVLEWIENTPNQFKSRAYVEGDLTRIFNDRTGHVHFAIQIGQRSRDEIEVVYNKSFGKLPLLQPGMNVVACGDYITSNAKFGPYLPSPVGAIIHWVHKSPSNKKHPSGFLVINGKLYGY